MYGDRHAAKAVTTAASATAKSAISAAAPAASSNGTSEDRGGNKQEGISSTGAATAEDKKNSASTSDTEEGEDSLDMDVFSTDSEENSGDEVQSNSEEMINNIDALTREMVSDMKEGDDLLPVSKKGDAKTQKTLHKKKATTKVKVPHVQTRKSPRRPTARKAPVGKSSGGSTAPSDVKHNDATVRLKGGPNGDMIRKLRRGDARGY